LSASVSFSKTQWTSGYAWLALLAIAILSMYGFVWVTEGHRAVASTFLDGGPLGLIGLGVLLTPGITFIALAVWMDRPRRRANRAGRHGSDKVVGPGMAKVGIDLDGSPA
jgi:hypothetical protein